MPDRAFVGQMCLIDTQADIVGCPMVYDRPEVIGEVSVRSDLPAVLGAIGTSLDFLTQFAESLD